MVLTDSDIVVILNLAKDLRTPQLARIFHPFLCSPNVEAALILVAVWPLSFRAKGNPS